MHATNGFGLRSRLCSLLGCAFVLLACGALMLPAAASAKKSKGPKATYLALGDSLAFGYMLQLYNEGEVEGNENPERFESGYVNQYYALTKGAKKHVVLQNDGCPGETTASMIGTGLAKSLNEKPAIKESQEKGESLPVTGESPCAYQEVWNAYKKVGAGGPLHHPYVGESQLENALKSIASAQSEGRPVTTITLNIGANDQLHAIKGIEKEIEAKVKAIAEKWVKETIIEPYVHAELQKKYIEPAVQKEIQEKYIDPAVYEKCSEKAFAKTGGEEPAFKEAREECLANEGQQLGEEYYAEHKAELEEKGHRLAGEYILEHQKELEEKGQQIGYEYYVAHKEELTKKGEEYGHKYAAEHYAELNAEAEQKVEELARGEGAYAGKSLFEQINSNISAILYAIRNGSEFGGVNYTGQIVFQGGYDPYGKLFRSQEEANTFVAEHGGATGPWATYDTGERLHPKFNALLAQLNSEEKATVNAYNACATDPEAYFNPGSVSAKGESKEAERLQTLTNMANGNKTGSKWDGPDIHATVAGYHELAKEMAKCKGLGKAGAVRSTRRARRSRRG